MVLAPRVGPGYARSNYIAISRVADTSAVRFQRFVCHELAHFWSTGAIPSGPDNWLNEGFAEFVSARFVREVSGEAAYAAILARWQQRGAKAPPVWTSSTTRRPVEASSYDKAPSILDALERRVGHSVMEQIVARFMTENVRTSPAVIAMVAEVAGRATGDWFRDELAK